MTQKRANGHAYNKILLLRWTETHANGPKRKLEGSKLQKALLKQGCGWKKFAQTC